MIISIYKTFLNKNIEELKCKIEYDNFVLENIDGDWRQYYVFLKDGYGLYVITEKRGNIDSVITCINIYHEDNLIESYRI